MSATTTVTEQIGRRQSVCDAAQASTSSPIDLATVSPALIAST
jgi:hypothetical protein